jgi:hypothetical protein
LRFEIGKLLLNAVLRLLVDAVDLAGNFLAFLLEVALGALLFLGGGPELGLAFPRELRASPRFLLPEVLVEFLRFLLGEFLTPAVRFSPSSQAFFPY